jgi:Putative beta-lactamase-inhibitor-like, PepSY-like
MKNTMIVMVMAIMCLTVKAQKISADKVPAAAKEAFARKFPQATGATWELEKTDLYEVNFHHGKLKQSAQFDTKGNWQATETDIEQAAVPKAVMDAFAKSYPGYKIKEAEKVETPAYKESYELEIIKGTEKLEVVFLPDGKVIKSGKD